MRPRRIVPLLVLGLALTLFGKPDARSYEFWWKNDNPSSGVHFIWGTGWARIYANTSQWSSSELGQIGTACGRWGAVEGADFAFQFKTNPWDPAVLTGWNNENDVYIDTLSPGTLGLTIIEVTGSQFNETDIIIDPTVASGIFGDDMESTVLHELGHALGLDHEDDVPAVMNTWANGVQRVLYPDDEDGVRALYPPSTPVTHKPGPDVAVTKVEHMPTMRLGTEVEVRWTFENRGTVGSSAFAAVVYLDGEKTPGPETGTELGRVSSAGLSPTQQTSGFLRVRVPDALLPGRWYLGVRAEGVVDDRNATNNAAAPPRPLETNRSGITVGPRDECRGTLGPYGHDRMLLELPSGLKVKMKVSTGGLTKKTSRRVNAKLGIHRPEISIPFDWDFGRKIKLKPTTDEAGIHEIRLTNDRAVPLTYKLRLKVAGQTLEGFEPTGRSIPFTAWTGGTLKISMKSTGSPLSLTLVDPDGDPVDVTDRLKVKSGGRKLKLKLPEVAKSGEYTLALGGPASVYVDYVIEVTTPSEGVVHERN